METKFLGDLIIGEFELDQNPDWYFVFGDNVLRRGMGGAAALRYHPRTIGFITKKEPNNQDSSFYRPEEYREVFEKELAILRQRIIDEPHNIFMISKLGGGLANRYKIWEQVIKDGLEKGLTIFDNVVFLWKR